MSNHGVAVGQFGAGLIVGGLTSAAVLGLIGGLLSPVPTPLRQGAFAGLAAALLARETGLVAFPLPENRRQVPRDVFGKGRVHASLQFGFEMGTGARTYMTSTVPYLLAAGLLLLGPTVAEVLVAGVGFGAGRWAVPLSWAVWGESWVDQFVAGGRVVSLLGMVAIAVAIV